MFIIHCSLNNNVPSIKTGRLRKTGILVAQEKKKQTIFNNGEFDPGSG